MVGFNLRRRVDKEQIEYYLTLFTKQKKNDHNYNSYNTLTNSVYLCLDYIDKIVHDTNAKYKRYSNKKSIRRLFKMGPKKDLLGNTQYKEIFQISNTNNPYFEYIMFGCINTYTKIFSPAKKAIIILMEHKLDIAVINYANRLHKETINILSLAVNLILINLANLREYEVICRLCLIRQFGNDLARYIMLF